MSTSDIIAGLITAFLGGSCFLLLFCLAIMLWDDYTSKKKRINRDKKTPL
jgi:hypothetical protein